MGRIAAPFGVHGWCRVQVFADDPGSLLRERMWWMKPRDGSAGWSRIQVHEARTYRDGVVAKVAGIESREAVLARRGTLIGLPRESLPRAEGEYFWSELLGFSVNDRAGTSLGVVKGLTDNGAHAILQVRDDESGRERLIPWVPAFIDGVDAEARRIDVDWSVDD